jgi:uncharacterized protein
MKQESPPARLDVKAFAQCKGVIAGTDLLSKYKRLMNETRGLGADRVLKWGVKGEHRVDAAGLDQVWLHLSVDVCLPLTCQRCLGLVDVSAVVSRSYRFVEDEEAAEVQDAQSEEDVLAFSAEFNLLDLIEDEVLMTLPVVPFHEICPVAVRLMVADPGFEIPMAEKRNPFAVLAELKRDKTS